MATIEYVRDKVAESDAILQNPYIAPEELADDDGAPR